MLEVKHQRNSSILVFNISILPQTRTNSICPASGSAEIDSKSESTYNISPVLVCQIDGPYKEMLKVTVATQQMAIANQNAPGKATPERESQKTDEFDWSTAEVTMTEPQTRQFVTLYKALQEFDDRAVHGRISCPRLCFAGSADKIDYGGKWGNVHVSLAQPLIRGRAELKALGWDVQVLEGLDHMRAMQARNALPVVRPWLISHLTALA